MVVWPPPPLFRVRKGSDKVKIPDPNYLWQWQTECLQSFLVFVSYWTLPVWRKLWRGFPHHQRRNPAFPVRVWLVQLCSLNSVDQNQLESRVERERVHPFLNRKHVNRVKKQGKQTVCVFLGFCWVQNARKRSVRFAKLELSVSIFSPKVKYCWILSECAHLLSE